MSKEVYLRIRAAQSDRPWYKNPPIETLALVDEEDANILIEYLQRYQTRYLFNLPNYKKLNLTFVAGEKDPTKVKTLYNFLGKKFVTGDDIIEQLYYEIEQMRDNEPEKYAELLAQIIG